jgi:putative selenium metabolism hydrolase
MDTKAVLAAAQSATPAMVNFLRDLIAIPSPSGEEGAVADRVLAEMRQLGYDEVFRDAAGNAVGRIGSGPLVIVYDCHMDTVAPASPAAWRHPPYAAVVDAGIVHGIGASDNKGGLAAIVFGGGLIRRLGLDGAFSLYVLGAVQEEHCEGLALKYFLDQLGVRPDFVVSGEASGLRLVRGHRGRTEVVATARGRTCHASMPQLGDNAILKATPFVEAVRAMSDRLLADPFLGQGTQVVSRIESTPDSVNAVPDSCTVYLDRRLTPGETETSVLDGLRILAGAGELSLEVPAYEGRSYTGQTLKGRAFFPAWSVAEDSDLVRAAARVAALVLSHAPEIGSWPFSTDGCYSAGTLGVPTIGFGPGYERFAHAVDDQVPVDHLSLCAAFYAALPAELSR